MTHIFILEHQPHRIEQISGELEKEGYRVTAFGKEAFNPETFECTQYDLAVLNLYPDSIRTWALHSDLRKRCPDFPMLVVLLRNIYGLRVLKNSINQILKKRECSRTDYQECFLA